MRAIIFDFDGVIANSEPLHYSALRDVLGEEGIPLAEADYYTRYLGYDDVGAFRAIAADRDIALEDEALERLLVRKARRLEQLESEGSVLFPGAAEAIRRAVAAVPIGIASGALRAEILRVLDAADLTRHFAVIVAAEDTASSKPSPDPYVLAVSQMARVVAGAPLRPSECVAIEDSRWGLQSAREAGLRTVGVANTYPASDLLDAELIITSLDRLDVEALRQLYR